MMKCSACGKRLKMKKDLRYEVMDTPSLPELLTGKKQSVLECFDCTYCGCQNVIGGRVLPDEDNKSNYSQDELDQAFRQGFEKGYERCKKDNDI